MTKKNILVLLKYQNFQVYCGNRKLKVSDAQELYIYIYIHAIFLWSSWYRYYSLIGSERLNE